MHLEKIELTEGLQQKWGMHYYLITTKKVDQEN